MEFKRLIVLEKSHYFFYTQKIKIQRKNNRNNSILIFKTFYNLN